MRDLIVNRLVALVVLVALVALGVSCGGGGEEPAAVATPTPKRATPAAPSPLPGQVSITYYGHSMFSIESPEGVVIITDPNDGIGYRTPSGPVDVLALSHDHFDHNKAEVAPGARILRGLTEDGDWADIDETIGDVRIRTVPTFHDDRQGADRGKTAMFLFQIGTLTILHAGDLGDAQEAFEQLEEGEAGSSVDLLLIPVGGHFTIGPEEADQVMDSLRPRVVIPMHYRTDVLRNFPDADKLAPVDDFLQGRTNVRRPGSSTLTVGPEPPEDRVIIVLDYQPR